MLPIFPAFSKITLEHKDQIESYWKNFEPYSDYNFTSMYSYDIEGAGSLSMLDNNVVMILPDYSTNQPTLSFLGTNNTTITANKLLDWATTVGLPKKLTLIGQEVIDNMEGQNDLIITEDPDNHDYVISATEMAKLTGRKWKSIRKEVNHFIEQNPGYRFIEVDVSDQKIRRQFENLFETWEDQNNKTEEETSTEFEALKRSFDLFGEPDHFAFGLFLDDKLIGYSTNQTAHNGFYLGHFGKADANFAGAYKIMEHECAKFFLEKGCKFMNYEQDLGIPGLRQAKRGWNPVGYLKKYIIRTKS